ncbi:bifunctional 2-polyprenyl-6-hydroxyphenol methylase/3-demethylubiquinol 3-O-methyltransferase UbiG [Hyphococcus luteus]|uniref:Ubiquinone biosynthesis O-methyltransferase n=1 Tax=Hyphococcus luteus TaxID=2058213 RepID=A0A2S7K1X1_9PROT|nr:bifunctional 2-polyprenyl-6-hydroxyphenol methylase/3-demethylubiquinol 3-O-methyltransferase UbiG [Marinicaulis flavus]PQA86493.1 bifunctional 3-demethylubiquinol 3-O-methyltransferase/2-polyprenyl-6-hydroxyphenol methylase [Marinicaulis flavus]
MAQSELTSADPAARSPSGRTTIDPDEVRKFSAIADEWWDPFGKFKPLHKFNPIRLAYIRDGACAHFGRDRRATAPLEGLSLLDIGCGGGLVAEPMRRLGAAVTAIDASERNIKTAMAHAEPLGLDIDYRATTVENLVEENAGPFDIVLNLEVVEHVADVDVFLETSANLIKPGGMTVMATINRTLKALALAKIGAEYVLRWLPAGTHDPRKFVKPEEAKSALTRAGLSVTAEAGVSYNPLMDIWRISDDTDVNYMLTALKG